MALQILTLQHRSWQRICWSYQVKPQALSNSLSISRMHGRPRPPKGYTPDPAAEKKAAQKAGLYAALAGEVLSRRKDRRYDPESLGLAAKLLELNPEVSATAKPAACLGDVVSLWQSPRTLTPSANLPLTIIGAVLQVYTVWNYRKEGVGSILDGEDRDAAVAAATEELSLTEKALMKNPKSYATWQHRKVQLPTPSEGVPDDPAWAPMTCRAEHFLPPAAVGGGAQAHSHGPRADARREVARSRRKELPRVGLQALACEADGHHSRGGA